MSPIEAKNSAPVVEGSLWSAIWHTSWPMFINMCAFALGSFIDTWVVGRLNADAQAAMGIGWQIRYFMMMLTIALEVGTIALVSRYFGARDSANTVEAARQALIFAGIFGLLSVFTGLLFSKWLLHLLGASPGVEQQGWDYLVFSLVSIIPSTLLWTSQSILRSIGDARSAMLTTMLGTTLIAILDPVLCLAPVHLGIKGIGIAWIISGSLAFSWNVIKLGQGELAGCLKIAESLRTGVSLNWFMRLMKIGIPGCIQEIALIIGSFGLFYVLSYLTNPAAVQAAWGIGWRVEELLVLTPMFALNTAIAIIVAQNLGAEQPHRAEVATWKITAVGFVINLFVAAVLWFFASNVASLMSTDSAVVDALANYLRIVAWTEPFFGSWFILCGAMQGAGYTRLPMIVTVISLCVLRVGAAWYLTDIYKFGATGTWIAMALTSVIAAAAMALVFQLGRWKHQTV
jgi:putative MATE family efflux protein